MKAVMLVGGYGTRLRDITGPDIPKPMVPVPFNEEKYPLLETVIGNLYKQGIRDYVFCTGYKAEKIEEHFGDGSEFGINIKYQGGGETLAPGAILKQAGRFIDDENFLLVCGDVYQAVPIDSFLDSFYSNPGLLGQMAVYRNVDELSSTVPNVAISKRGVVTDYSKEGAKGEITGVETGFLAFKTSVLDIIPEGNAATILGDLYPSLIKEGRFGGFVTDERFFDVGTPERYRLFCDYVKQENIMPLSLMGARG
ncbi:MAG: hypothetical protein HGA85_02450 [Nanoarchaeota archaeon]|nr:hypothetical protein [Nanoarchaeota archaeon]